MSQLFLALAFECIVQSFAEVKYDDVNASWGEEHLMCSIKDALETNDIYYNLFIH